VERSDVIVVGAGPTGLLLASELALQGVKVMVLERLSEADATIKAGSVNVASAEILDRRGLLPAAEEVQRAFIEAAGLFKAGRSNTTASGLLDAAAKAARRFPVLGHFGGIMFRNDLVDQTDPVLAEHTAVADGVAVPQHALELMLAEHCARLGVEIRRGVSVLGVRSLGADLLDDADVTVETDAGEFITGWVVAADGGRSTIRKQLGIEFVGTAPEMVGYQGVADFENVEGLRRGWNWTPRGVYAFGPMPGRILLAYFGQMPADRDAPVTAQELQEKVREVTGFDVTVNGLQGVVTRWTDNARMAESYRHGRVLLAGDAAHVHSPFSGQGLNLGFGDAVNLGWKLAATIKGWAPQGLIDTYERERQPIAAWVLDWTRAQVALMRGDVRTEQLREVVGDELFTVPGAMNHIIALSSGVSQHYDVSADTAAPVGTTAGNVELDAGGRLADYAHDGRFVLIDRSPHGRFAGEVRRLDHWIAYVADRTTDASRPSLLVRPDGIIVWAAPQDSDRTDDAWELLVAAIARWIGDR
jgi:2-polyprenyl-6-methoxyphenol hydroxylase-like FAD-dependent oxidoreductase